MPSPQTAVSWRRLCSSGCRCCDGAFEQGGALSCPPAVPWALAAEARDCIVISHVEARNLPRAWAKGRRPHQRERGDTGDGNDRKAWAGEQALGSLCRQRGGPFLCLCFRRRRRRRRRRRSRRRRRRRFLLDHLDLRQNERAEVPAQQGQVIESE